MVKISNKIDILGGSGQKTNKEQPKMTVSTDTKKIWKFKTQELQIRYW